MRTIKENSTLEEMLIGIFFLGAVCQAAGALTAGDQIFYAKSLWAGILLAAASAFHMCRSWERALDDEKNAPKIIFRTYLIRNVLITGILFIIMITGILDPRTVFMAYMTLKITAFVQPITHKICVRLGIFLKER